MIWLKELAIDDMAQRIVLSNLRGMSKFIGSTSASIPHQCFDSKIDFLSPGKIRDRRIYSKSKFHDLFRNRNISV